VSAAVQAPQEVDAAAVFEVSWQGPGNANDYISIASLDQKPGEYQYYTYTRTGSPVKLQAPSDPGSYEVRYILSQGNKILAKTPITVSPVTAAVTVPAAAAVDSSIEIAWEGPGYKPDYICIAKPDDLPGKYLGYTYVKTGNPLQLKAPKDPGVYEVRYILGQGNRLLDKKSITVE
jgi:Ca-activated chloride channel family protein